MKVLFITPGNIASPIQEIELEIMQEHIDAGDEIFVLVCHGELPSCWINPGHSKLQCMYCKSRLHNGYKLLSKNIHVLPLIDIHPDQQNKIDQFKVDADTNEDLKKIYVEDFDLGWALLSTKITNTRNPYPDLKDCKEELNRWAKTSLMIYYSVKNHIQHHTYDLAYVYNGRSKDTRPILRVLQHAGQKLNTYNTGGVYHSYGIFPDTFIHDREKTEQQIIKLWKSEPDEIKKIKIASEFYENRFKGKFSVGPNFVQGMAGNQLPENFDPHKKNISIFISSEDENFAIGDYWNYEFYRDQLDGLNQLSKSMDLFPVDEYDFYLRVHPNLKSVSNPYSDLLKNYTHPRIKLIPADSAVNTYELIRYSDKVICFGSTVAAEATYLEKPSIECGKSFFMNLGSNYIPKNHQELLQLILENKLPPKPKLGILMYSYWWLQYGQKPKYLKFVTDTQLTFKGKTLQSSWWLETLKKIKNRNKNI